MKHFKIFFLFVLINLFVTAVSGQANRVNVTVTPSQTPDTMTKAAIVIENAQQKSTTAATENHQSVTVTPESKLSIGTATAVTSPDRANPAPAATRDATVNHSEQKVEKTEVPANNAAIIPK